ncbi:recombinase family protein [Paraglaciecola chathamensis]|nr:recombinase family protein [Paraglaciecola chathamensis]
MIGSIAQFERRLIYERAKSGLQAVRARGREVDRK